MVRHSVKIAIALCAFLAGCMMTNRARVMTDIQNPNPLVVRANNSEDLWEWVVDSINDYHFEIAREDRLEGVIETEYKTGANIFEPWHPDAVGSHNRLEGTFQSIQRRAIVTILPTNMRGHYQIGVQVEKQLEDLSGLAANSPGDATFGQNQPFQRNLQNVVGQTQPSAWIDLGRDPALEQSMLSHIKAVLPRECLPSELMPRGAGQLRR